MKMLHLQQSIAHHLYQCIIAFCMIGFSHEQIFQFELSWIDEPLH